MSQKIDLKVEYTNRLAQENEALKAQIEQKSKVIEHIAAAVGEEADPMACWEAVEALKAQLAEVQDNRTGKAPCERFCEALATKKMFDNLQSDNRQLKAQVYRIRNIIENERDIIPKLYDVLNSIPARHPDDKAVDRFATAMKTKLAAARAKGRGGWDDKASCSGEHLAQLLIEHLTKGNAGTFEDIANFAMMLHQRGEDPQLLRTALVLRDAEIKAQAVEDARYSCEKSLLTVIDSHTGAQDFIACCESNDLAEYANQLRQQAKEQK